MAPGGAVERAACAEALKLGGTIAKDVGEVLPYVAAAYAVIKVIVDLAQAAQAMHGTCQLLAKQVAGIESSLRAYFGRQCEKPKLENDHEQHCRLVECLADLTSALESTCSLVEKFSSANRWNEKVWRVVMAKNYQGEFQTCSDKLDKVEAQLSRIVSFKIAFCQELFEQAHEQRHQQLLGAIEKDKIKDRPKLEEQLGSRPEKSAVLQMHGIRVDIHKPYTDASNSGGLSTGPTKTEPWYVDASFIRKELDQWNQHINLGSGGFGTVFKGICFGLNVAIKEVPAQTLDALIELKNEIDTMWRLTHANIIQTRGGFYPLENDAQHSRMSFILLEYASKGSLDKHMFRNCIQGVLPQTQLLDIFSGIVNGLKYLHSAKVIHRDVKPQNILLTEDYTAKISDFGLAREQQTGASAPTGKVGTYAYMAPEVMRGDGYDRTCDVWSFGVMLYEMVLGEHMFGSATPVEIDMTLRDPTKGVPWHRLKNSVYAAAWPAWLANIAEACLKINARERPSMAEISVTFRKQGVSVSAAAASSSSASTVEVDALGALVSHVTVVSSGQGAPSPSTGGTSAGPSGSRPVQAQAQSADDMLRCAEEWEKAGDVAYAYEYFKLAAQAGVAEGQFRLGKILLEGSHGMSQHLEYGAGWVRAAAETGRTDAMVEYGRCHHSGRGVPQNWSLAKEWYEKAAKLGSPAGSAWLEALLAEEWKACRDAADWRRRGRIEEFTNKNFTEAQLWYHKAAQMGDAYSQCQIGYFYHMGLGGLREDKGAAVEWYRKASDQGRADAQYNLGLCYEFGEGGLLQNKRAAVEWYRKAAEQGEARAQYRLSRSYENGSGGLPQDKIAAVKWYRKAAEQGYAQAQSNLGLCYENGWGGLPRDNCAAVEWYRKAADQGFAAAQCNLGRCYENGWGGLPRDKHRAVEWYRKSAEQGNAAAQCNLGRCYENGWGGLPRNKRAAADSYRRAAEQGQAEAKRLLATSGHKHS